MSAAGPTQGANNAPPGGSAAATAASVGVVQSAAGPSQGANSTPSGGSAAAAVVHPAASVGVVQCAARPSPVTMRRGETAAAVALLLFACAILWGSVLMPSGTVGAPGPGFFPRALGSLLALVSVGLLVRSLRLDPAVDEVVALGHRHIALTLVALVGLGLMLEYAGYVLSATLFMLVLLRAFSTLGWTRSMLAAGATALVSYFLFVHLLSVMLPAGLLQFH